MGAFRGPVVMSVFVQAMQTGINFEAHNTRWSERDKHTKSPPLQAFFFSHFLTRENNQLGAVWSSHWRSSASLEPSNTLKTVEN